MADIVKMLRDDHKKVKGLFDRFEKTEDSSEQEEIMQQALQELQIHSAIEMKLVYPLLEHEEGEEDTIQEAYEEHHVVDLLIGELKSMNGGPVDGHLKAKFTVLAENVRHHIKEEESEILPKLEKGDADLDAIGEQAAELKEQFESDPSLLEHENSGKGRGRSMRRNAQASRQGARSTSSGRSSRPEARQGSRQGSSREDKVDSGSSMAAGRGASSAKRSARRAGGISASSNGSPARAQGEKKGESRSRTSTRASSGSRNGGKSQSSSSGKRSGSRSTAAARARRSSGASRSNGSTGPKSSRPRSRSKAASR